MISRPWLVIITILLCQHLTLSMESRVQNKHQKQSKEITEINLRMKKEFEDVATGLERVINFMVSNTKDVNLDAAYAVILCQNNLKTILDKFIARNVFPSAIEDVKAMIKKTQYLIDESRKRIDQLSRNYKKLAPILLNSELWSFKTRQIEKPFVFEPQFWTSNNAFDRTFIGRPNEESSDQCIIELIDSVSRNNYKCQVSDYCKEVIHDQPLNESTGYSLTHRLLHYQTGRAIGCKDWDKLLDTLSWDYCNKIASENIEIAKIKFPYFSQDLFLEQLILCGLEGYKQIWKPKWTSAILSWQTYEGCFGSLGRRKKRESNRIGVNKCGSHFTALAGAAFAMRLNWILEEYDIWPQIIN